uniref:Uncharacterized protein n=1 Tax=Oryza glaberrima TaxID=4538 RepID=I1NQ34_ORYGL
PKGRTAILQAADVPLYYNRVVVGRWGEVPAFCVDKLSAVDLNVAMSREGVSLPQRLREAMAADMHVGELELAVEMKPARPEDVSRACFHSCAARSGKFGNPCKRFCVFSSRELRDFVH